MASKLQIVEWPHPALTSKAEPVTEFNQDIAALVEDMHHTMRIAGGIGLAANQVNVLKRIVVMGAVGYRLTFINPKIVETYGQTSIQEGCLSFPDVTVSVPRHEIVAVRAHRADGSLFQIRLSGILSICAQHEIDHLNGICFTEKLGRV